MSDALAAILLAVLMVSPFALFLLVRRERKRGTTSADTAAGDLGYAGNDHPSGGGAQTYDVGGHVGSPDLPGFDATPTPDGGGGDSD